jgi:hypothetical protein
MDGGNLGRTAANSIPMGYADEAVGKMAPSKDSLVDILRQKRMLMLEELRNIEQALEALESNPTFDQVFMRVNKILRRM